MCLLDKSFAALRRTGLRTLCVGGGVAANARFRERAEEAARAAGVQLYIAPLRLCTDNAVMGAIAWSATRPGCSRSWIWMFIRGWCGERRRACSVAFRSAKVAQLSRSERRHYETGAEFAARMPVFQAEFSAKALSHPRFVQVFAVDGNSNCNTGADGFSARRPVPLQPQEFRPCHPRSSRLRS